MGRGQVPLSQVLGAVDFHQYFDQKVADVRALTEDAPPPSFSVAPLDCKFVDFQPLTIEDVVSAIKSLPDKQCASTMPTRLLKDCADILAPFFVDIFNESLRTSSLPTVFKAAYITPLIRKADLDVDDVRSYRPISNLPVLSKLLERLVSRQLLDYITAEGLMPALQSAYRLFHSTETAVLEVLADILRALDNGNAA